jgi:hypothetical protein
VNTTPSRSREIESLDCEVPMKEINRRVTFEESSGLGEII